MRQNKKISIVSPVYNEEEGIVVFVESVYKALEAVNYNFEVILVDDGSTDGSLEIIKDLATKFNNLYFIELSKNFGHQQALKAGLDYAKGDAIISMDSDLQHPPEMIKDLIKEWEGGFDIVYTIRETTESISLFKKVTSKFYYRILTSISGIQIHPGVADFRLLDSEVLKVLKTINESDLFIRGIVNWMGYKTKAIKFSAGKRLLGETKYTLTKMLRLAVHGVLSTTTRPLNFAMYLGISISLLCLLYIPYIIFSYYSGSTVSGWISIIVTISFLGGLQLFILGIIGLYLGKLYTQTKQRPGYLIRESNII